MLLLLVVLLVLIKLMLCDQEQQHEKLLVRLGAASGAQPMYLDVMMGRVF